MMDEKEETDSVHTWPSEEMELHSEASQEKRQVRHAKRAREKEDRERRQSASPTPKRRKTAKKGLSITLIDACIAH